MGLDAGERHHRPDLGRHYHRRVAWHRSLGSRAAGRNQYGVWRHGVDRDGAACPRGCGLGPLSGTPCLSLELVPGWGALDQPPTGVTRDYLTLRYCAPRTAETGQHPTVNHKRLLVCTAYREPHDSVSGNRNHPPGLTLLFGITAHIGARGLLRSLWLTSYEIGGRRDEACAGTLWFRMLQLRNAPVRWYGACPIRYNCRFNQTEFGRAKFVRQEWG